MFSRDGVIDKFGSIKKIRSIIKIESFLSMIATSKTNFRDGGEGGETTELSPASSQVANYILH